MTREGTAPKPKCPICQRHANLRAENEAFPFCSPRCKQVDLGKWLKEEYRVPVEASDSDESTEGGGGQQN